ncbi:MAG: glutaredoxin domain-containing protein [Anaerolineales bacterium]|nr:MAG: glutaredoxin domain-containing protein [Anaerolineales bacterium]
MDKPIIVYSAEWCSDCKRSRAFLKRHGIVYENVNVDENPEAAETVKRINGGNRSIPTIVFPDGSILVEPSDRELAEKLGISASR